MHGTDFLSFDRVHISSQSYLMTRMPVEVRHSHSYALFSPSPSLSAHTHIYTYHPHTERERHAQAGSTRKGWCGDDAQPPALFLVVIEHAESSFYTHGRCHRACSSSITSPASVRIAVQRQGRQGDRSARRIRRREDDIAQHAHAIRKTRSAHHGAPWRCVR